MKRKTGLKFDVFEKRVLVRVFDFWLMHNLFIFNLRSISESDLPGYYPVIPL
jgi:hypothetical protein